MIYRRILVATDGSSTAQMAMEAGFDLAARLRAEVVILCAWGSAQLPLGRARVAAEAARGAAEKHGLEPAVELAEGEAPVRIAEAAERLRCDLVVVGSKGMGHPSRFHLGSVADRTAHLAPSDVLIVRTSGPAPRRADTGYRRIVAATDGSPAAELAARRAFELARVGRGSVILVHAGDPVVGPVVLERTAAGAPRGVEVFTEEVKGAAAEAICELAERRDADLVVVGRRGLTGMVRLLLGSVSTKVAHYSPTDVLIVREDRIRLDSLEPGTGAVVEIAGSKVAAFRDEEGHAHLLSARCTHMGCTVGWNPAERTWDCPCHGSRFRVDGSVLQGPANRPLDLVAPTGALLTAPRPPVPARVPGPSARRRTGPRVVIVGAGLTGGTAAVTLRAEGFDGPVVLIGAEPHPPYERPPLSKSFLRGETEFSEAFVMPEPDLRANDIETRFGATVVRVDTAARELVVAGGERVPYDRLLVATGCRNRRPPIPGMDREGVYDLRTIEDCERLRAEASPGRHGVVIGMGFIGCEVAASLRGRGVEVTVVERAAGPLHHVLGPEVAEVLAGIHRERGVRPLFGDQVASLEGAERVEAVVTSSGRRIDCDFVVVALGVKPVTDLLAGAGVAVEDGIVVDELCRTTVPDVFAAGDVASHHHPLFGRRIRTEHWQHARKHGEAAGRSIMGRGRAYDEVPWFWSDQYEHNVQYTGHHTTWDRIVIRGSLQERSFLAFYLEDGMIAAAAALNRGDELERTKALIRAARPIDPVRLGSDSVALESA